MRKTTSLLEMTTGLSQTCSLPRFLNTIVGLVIPVKSGDRGMPARGYERRECVWVTAVGKSDTGYEEERRSGAKPAGTMGRELLLILPIWHHIVFETFFSQTQMPEFWLKFNLIPMSSQFPSNLADEH